jgi:hypothetical protein
VTAPPAFARAVLPAAAAGAILIAAAALVPDAVRRTVLSPHVMQALGAIVKLTFLLLAAVFAWRTARAFEAGNPVRPAWRLLALGMFAFFLAQLSYAPYQIVLNQDPPYPSVADVLFMLAYPLLIAALFVFLRAYEEAGYPVGSAPSRWGLAAAVAAGCALVGYVILTPVIRADTPALEKALNVAYPVLDFVLLVPTVLLIRTTMALRGGAAWKVWAALLAGYVFLCVGDVLFAYLGVADVGGVDPLIHAMYVLSYGLIARGVLYQHELVA